MCLPISSWKSCWIVRWIISCRLQSRRCPSWHVRGWSTVFNSIRVALKRGKRRKFKINLIKKKFSAVAKLPPNIFLHRYTERQRSHKRYLHLFYTFLFLSLSPTKRNTTFYCVNYIPFKIALNPHRREINSINRAVLFLLLCIFISRVPKIFIFRIFFKKKDKKVFA